MTKDTYDDLRRHFNYSKEARVNECFLIIVFRQEQYREFYHKLTESNEVYHGQR